MDSIAKGRASDPSTVVLRGEDNPQAKLRAVDIPSIRQRIAAGDSLKAIAATYNVSSSTIAGIKYGNTWRDA